MARALRIVSHAANRLAEVAISSPTTKIAVMDKSRERIVSDVRRSCAGTAPFTLWTVEAPWLFTELSLCGRNARMPIRRDDSSYAMGRRTGDPLTAGIDLKSPPSLEASQGPHRCLRQA